MLLLLTGKYVSGGGPAEAEKARILLKLMQFIGAVSGGKTVTQVALNYLMCKGEHILLSQCLLYLTACAFRHHMTWHLLEVEGIGVLSDLCLPQNWCVPIWIDEAFKSSGFGSMSIVGPIDSRPAYGAVHADQH